MTRSSASCRCATSCACGPASGRPRLLLHMERLSFRMPDPERRLRGVRLQQDVRLPGELLGFTRAGDDWVLTVPRPDVDRMEYSFELQHTDGGSEWVCDPGNPLRVGGAFGDKSVLELPEYSAPKWLDADPTRGDKRELSLPSR